MSSHLRGSGVQGAAVLGGAARAPLLEPSRLLLELRLRVLLLGSSAAPAQSEVLWPGVATLLGPALRNIFIGGACVRARDWLVGAPMAGRVIRRRVLGWLQWCIELRLGREGCGVGRGPRWSEGLRYCLVMRALADAFWWLAIKRWGEKHIDVAGLGSSGH